MTTVKDIYLYIDSFAPFSAQADWDNSGLLVGGMERPVKKVLICLDLTRATAAFAAENGCELIVSHHPVIFHSVKSVPCASVLWTLIRNGISVISAHTNLDKAPGGVNDTLCALLGMNYEKCLPEHADGFLNIGTFSDRFDVPALADHLKRVLGGSVRYIDAGAPIERVAVCAGAGGEFAAEATFLGCSALITGDADHHDFLDAAAAGVSLFAAGHYETEIPIVPVLAEKLRTAFTDTEFIICPINNPICSL